MIINEGIGDVFRDMPSLGQFKDDVYRYLVYHNSPLVDKIDKDYFNIERVNDVNNPRYFISGPNKNRFQLPNRIIKDKTKLYFRFYINLSSKDMLLEIGINLKDDSNKLIEIKPYRNNIKILDFINKWSNYNWSNEMKLAINDLSKKLNLNRDPEKLDDTELNNSFEKFLDWAGINDIYSLCEGVLKELEKIDINVSTKQLIDAIKNLYKSLGREDFIKRYKLSKDDGQDLATMSEFIDDLSKKLR